MYLIVSLVRDELYKLLVSSAAFALIYIPACYYIAFTVHEKQMILKLVNSKIRKNN